MRVLKTLAVSERAPPVRRVYLLRFAIITIASLCLTGCWGDGITGGGRNRPPRFLTTPPLRADHDLTYTYDFEVQDPDGDPVTITLEALPDWLQYDSLNTLITGTPGEARIREGSWVRIVASDGEWWVDQSYTLQVVLGISTLVFDGWWMTEFGPAHHHGHDGHPYESENFLVFSDFVPQEERKLWSDTLEAHQAELMDSLSVASTAEFAYVTPDRRLHVMFSRHQRFPGGAGGAASHAGFMLYSSDYYDDNPNSIWRESYSLILKHEVMHCVEALLSNGMLGQPWWVEGIAEYVSDLSGLRLQYKVTRYSDLQESENPIAVRTWTRWAALGTSKVLYDTYMEVAVRYLLDPAGGGRTWGDVRNMYWSIRQGTAFEEAFALHMGMTVGYFQAHFFELMRAYLP
jgi:hypothetical protein